MIEVTEKFLDENTNIMFVFGDNLSRMGKGGAAKLRHHPQSWGFITKKYPSNKDSSFYEVEEYKPIFKAEMELLKAKLMETEHTHTWLISPVGSGLANKYHIWEEIIKPEMDKELILFPNAIRLWRTHQLPTDLLS